VGRNYAIRLEKEEVEGLGRYGEEKAAKPFAVSCMGIVRCMVGMFEGSKLVNWLVRSVRHVWEVVRGGVKKAAVTPPRTCVNNCTRDAMQATGILPDYGFGLYRTG